MREKGLNNHPYRQDFGKFHVFCRNFAIIATINMNATAQQLILEYAENHKYFSLGDLFVYMNGLPGGIKQKTLSWHLFNLTNKHLLTRIGRGCYSKYNKALFAPEPTQEIKRLYRDLHTTFPFANFCIYTGEIISPLLHHLTPNQVLYVETDKDSTETVFNYLKNKKPNIFLRPSKEMIYRYVDMNEPQIFVKNLISESPLQKTAGIPSPTIEKLLVDLQSDSDFFHLQETEGFNILENAFNLYEINKDKLLRYASRRNMRNTLLADLQKINIR